MTDFLEFLLETFKLSGMSEPRLHVVELVTVITGLLTSMGVVGFIAGVFRFKKRAFFNQMVIGVNILERLPDDGCWVLKLRTLVENNLDTLLDNPTLQRLVIRAAKKCTVDDPILRLKNKEDHALLLTKIQNAISSIYAGPHLQHMTGQEFDAKWADFVVTCERYGGLKATKIRVLVFVEADIERLVDDEFRDAVSVEEPHHRDRLVTLRRIALASAGGKPIVRGRVEILVSR